MNTNKKTLNILIFLTVYVFLKLLILHNYGIITKDGAIYATLGKYFYDLDFKNAINVIFPPLYPLLIAFFSIPTKIIFLIFPKINIYFSLFELSGIICSTFFHILLAFTVYYTGKKKYDLKFARISFILTLFYPSLIKYSSEVLTESLFSFLLFGGVFSLIYSNKKRFTALSALFFGLSYYVKPEGLLIGLLFFIIFSLFDKSGFFEKIKKFFIFLFILFLISAPYIYFLYLKFGKFLLSAKQTFVFYLAIKRTFPDINIPKNISTIGFIQHYPYYAYKKLLKGLFYLIWHLPEAFFRIYLLFFVIYAIKRKNKSRYEKTIYIFILIYFLMIAFYNPDKRYFVPFIPLIIFQISSGFLYLTKYFEQKIKKINTEYALLTLTIAISFFKSIPGMEYDKYNIKIIGKALNKIKTFKKIASDDARYAFYAEGKHIFFRDIDKFAPDIIIFDTKEDKTEFEKFKKSKILLNNRIFIEFTLNGKKYIAYSDKKNKSSLLKLIDICINISQKQQND